MKMTLLPPTTYTLSLLSPASLGGLGDYFLLLEVNFQGSPKGNTNMHFVLVYITPNYSFNIRNSWFINIDFLLLNCHV